MPKNQFTIACGVADKISDKTLYEAATAIRSLDRAALIEPGSKIHDVLGRHGIPQEEYSAFLDTLFMLKFIEYYEKHQEAGQISGAV